MKMRFIEGPFTGRTIDLPDSGMLIGRDKTCDLALNGDKVSRRHARIMVDKHGIIVEDLQSMNGVYVNGDKIHQPRALISGDRLRVGNHLLLLSTDDAVLSETAVARVEERVRHRGSAGVPAMAQYWIAALIFLAVAGLGALVTVNLLQEDGPHPAAVDPVTQELANRLDQPDETYWDGDDGSLRSTVQDPTATQPKQPRPTDAVAARTVNHFWVQTQPPGATVYLNGEQIGTSPLLLRDLPDTTTGHKLRLELTGYEPIERSIFIPYSSDYPVYQLTIKPGNTLITSSPSGASVYDGSQLLGRTPYWMRGFSPGEHQLIISHAGRARAELTAEVFDYRGNHQHINLDDITGTLRIRALPAGARVRLDGVDVGPTRPLPDGEEVPSEPLVLRQVHPGSRRVTISYDGRESPAFTVSLPSGGSADVLAYVWLPNCRVTTNDGRQTIGVLLGREPDGTCRLGLEDGKVVTFPPTAIKETQMRSFAIAADRHGQW